MSTSNIKKSVMLLGAAGQIANAFVHYVLSLEKTRTISLVARTRESLDITNISKLKEQIEQYKPEVIVNCAEFSALSGAELSQFKCWHTNVYAVAALAKLCSQKAIPLIHISSAHVFGLDAVYRKRAADNDLANWTGVGLDHKKLCYREEDAPSPAGVYASSKVAAEMAILQEAAENPLFEYWILRPGFVFERHNRPTKNILSSWASRALSQPTAMQLPSDSYFSLCCAEDVAWLLYWMIENCTAWYKGSGPVFPKGIYHVANTGVTTWFEVMRYVNSFIGREDLINPAKSVAFFEQEGFRNPVTFYQGLCTDKLTALAAPKMLSWQSAISNWVAAYLGTT